MKGENMTEKLKKMLNTKIEDTIYRYMDYCKKSIDDIVNKRGSSLSEGKNLIPLGYKYNLDFLFEKIGTDNPHYTEIKNDYYPLKNQIEQINKDFNVEDLQQEINTNVLHLFPGIFEDFSDIQTYSQDADHDLFLRDNLEFALMELHQKIDIKMLASMEPNQKNNIRVLESNVANYDLGFKCIYTREIKDVIKFGCNFEISYYPDNFWWRHPSKILAEKQARLK